MPPEREFLLYPLDTGECDRCRLPVLLAAHEVREGKPDFLAFRRERCAARKSSCVRMMPLTSPGARRRQGFCVHVVSIC